MVPPLCEKAAVSAQRTEHKLPLEDLSLVDHYAADSSTVDFAVSGASYQLEQEGRSPLASCSAGEVVAADCYH
jgi:hypothetical protein